MDNLLLILTTFPLTITVKVQIKKTQQIMEISLKMVHPIHPRTKFHHKMAHQTHLRTELHRRMEIAHKMEHLAHPKIVHQTHLKMELQTHH